MDVIRVVMDEAEMLAEVLNDQEASAKILHFNAIVVMAAFGNLVQQTTDNSQCCVARQRSQA